VFPFSPLVDGDEVHVGQVVLTVVHTPGHRPEEISLLVTNPARSPEPSMLLSGDTLFVGDVGRPDFGGREGATQQYASVRHLLELPDYVEVFPSHFEGSCGKGMCGRPSTTIGFERRFNPLLQLTEADFLAMAAEVPARPLNMTAILEANRGALEYTWPIAHAAPAVRSITAAAAPAWLEERGGAPLILDVREPSEYAEGHVPNALNVPQADLAVRLAEVPRDREILTVCRSGTRSLKAAEFLATIGYGRITNMLGGTTAWIAAGLPVTVP
jgi:rhodanese-related sulfurtransferase